MNVRLLPDAPLSDDTELVFIDGRTFVNAAKHEEVVALHVAEKERVRELGQMMTGMLEAIWSAALAGNVPNPEKLRERIDWYARQLALALDENREGGS